MHLLELDLSNFRSYSRKKLELPSSCTVILGDNAKGKTNLLEAIFFLSTGKSFRAEKDTEMIAFEKEMAMVKGIISEKGRTLSGSDPNQFELEILLTCGEVMGIKTPNKKYSVNGVARRMIDFVGNLRTVLFWPEDLELVTDSPGRRRRYLDFVLLQTDREYRRNRESYEKGVRQRNRVLEAIRDHGAHRHQLIFWDQLLIKDGNYISKKREEYINFINRSQTLNPKSQINFKFQDLNYQIVYDKSVISEARLAEYTEEEVAAAVTLVGPHRDDIKFKIQSSKFRKTKDTSESRDLSQYGSRGEQRLGILWLKMGELAYVEESTGGKPILLLDDIFSELDHEHRKIIFDIIGSQQTIMTTTDLHHIEKGKLKNIELIEL